MKVLSPREALSALALAKEFHDGKRSLPPEILEKKREIRDATRNAQLFVARTGAVDMNMLDLALRLRLELDELYGKWVQWENKSLVSKSTQSRASESLQK